LLEDYAARLVQAEDQPMGLSAQGGPLRIAQPLAADVPHPTPRPSLRSDSWVQLPQNPEAGEAGSGYGVYGTDLSGRQGTHANAQWGDPRTMRVIGAVTGHLANGSQETPFEVGNISLEGGKSFKPDHNGHVDGLGIDVRPGRQGTEPGPLDYRSPNYDRDATRRLIGAFQATGQVDKIYFNDPDIGVKGVTPWAGHNDHLHFQLKR
jgi:penicillin-insensitive murein DD-endopeptidase